MLRQFTIIQRHIINVDIHDYTAAEAGVLEQMVQEGDAPLAALKSHGYTVTSCDSGVEVYDQQVCRICGWTEDDCGENMIPFGADVCSGCETKLPAV